ncbi:MAG: CPBP family intramembrane glutamic endopeptidase [Halobacteriota archaeon]
MRLRDTTPVSATPAVKVPTVFNLAWYELLVLLLILVGEGLLFAGYSVLNIGVQTITIIAVAVIVVGRHGDRVQLVEALALISVFYAVSFLLGRVSIIYSIVIVLVIFLPLIFVIPTLPLYFWVMSYGVLFVPIIAIVAHRKLNNYDLGLMGGLRLTYLIPVGVLIGAGIGFIEYAILMPQALILNMSPSQIIGVSIVMIFFVAIVEELLFRVLLQPQFIERGGVVAGILITSVLFGFWHAYYANVYELLFTTGAGVIFGVAFYKTKNLPFVVTMHAVDDILLFGVLPFLPLALPH